METNENLVESSSQKSEIWVSFDKEGEDQREISVQIFVLKMGQFFWEDDQDQHSWDTVRFSNQIESSHHSWWTLPRCRDFFCTFCEQTLWANRVVPKFWCPGYAKISRDGNKLGCRSKFQSLVTRRGSPSSRCLDRWLPLHWDSYWVCGLTAYRYAQPQNLGLPKWMVPPKKSRTLYNHSWWGYKTLYGGYYIPIPSPNCTARKSFFKSIPC